MVTSMTDFQITTFTGTLSVKKLGERHWLFRHALILFIYTKEEKIAHISKVFLEILVFTSSHTCRSIKFLLTVIHFRPGPHS